MMQGDLFEDRRCGTCVHRNASRESDAGSCTPIPELHQPDEPACLWWFGLEQLRQACKPKRVSA